MQGVWRQLGVNVDVQKLSPTDYINGLEQHKLQSYVRLDGPGVVETGYFLGYDMKCGIGFNPRRTAARARRKLRDPKAKQKIFDQVNKLWVTNSPKIHVYEGSTTSE